MIVVSTITAILTIDNHWLIIIFLSANYHHYNDLITFKLSMYHRSDDVTTP